MDRGIGSSPVSALPERKSQAARQYVLCTAGSIREFSSLSTRRFSSARPPSAPFEQIQNQGADIARDGRTSLAKGILMRQPGGLLPQFGREHFLRERLALDAGRRGRGCQERRGAWGCLARLIFNAVGCLKGEIIGCVALFERFQGVHG